MSDHHTVRRKSGPIEQKFIDDLVLPWEQQVLQGAKYDGGKPDIELIMRQFPLALQVLPWAAMYGAVKYEDDDGQSYKQVPNGRRRYASAELRHKLAELTGERYAQDSHVLHAIHKAWNAMAQLEFLMAEGDTPPIDPDWSHTYMDDWKAQAQKIKESK